MNHRKLKATMVERGVKVEAIASELGITPSMTYRKLKNVDKFTIGDVKKLKAILNLTNEEACEIFLQ